MDAIDNHWVRVSFASGQYDHAIKVEWKSPPTTDNFINEMDRVRNLFREHASFTVLALDYTAQFTLAREAKAWVKAQFIPALSGQVQQVMLGCPQDCIDEFKDGFEAAGMLVKVVHQKKALEAALASL